MNNIGPKTFAKSAQYDVLFKDIIINSEQRNTTKYPLPNGYKVNFQGINNQIFKAELIEVYVPSATDTAINIKPDKNRLYFSYTYNTSNTIEGFVVVQAGTYLSPQTLGKEIQRQLDLFFSQAIPANTNLTYGITIGYNVNLNRYIIGDRSANKYQTITLKVIGDTFNGEVITNTIQEALKLYVSEVEYLTSNPLIIKKNGDNIIKPTIATTGDYGFYNNNGVTGFITLDKDAVFGNSILSDVVLTNCKIFLSLGPSLNPSDSTLTFVIKENNSTKVVPGNVFCQVPTNSPVSSASVKTLLNQPAFYSSVQYYNPCINNLNNLVITWYDEYGNLLDNILDHCLTVRVFYYQKNNPITDISTKSTIGYGNY